MDFPLKPLHTVPRANKIVVWDIETDRDMNPFLVGVRDATGPQQFGGSKCISQFIDWCLAYATEHDGTVFYAHNGGGFDHLFAIYECVERQKGRFKVGPVLSGGSAIIVFIEEKETGRSFMLADSMRLLNMGLKKIGAALGGEQKQDFDVLNTPTNDPRWREYNNQDTLVLYQALTKLQGAIADLGGEMKITAASSALDLFRRKYLKQHIYPQIDSQEFYRKTYFGGRVEIFDMRRRTDVHLYDINSLYPYACTFPLPVELVNKGKEAIDDVESGVWFDRFSYFAHCLVEIPDSVNIPPLPVRRDNKLIFPVGRFWGDWNSYDLRNLLLCGGKILKVTKAHKYRCEPIAEDMMRNLYAARLDKERPEMGLAAKLLMNSWYGKTGQKTDRDKLLFCPSPEDLKYLDEGSGGWECKNEKADLWASHYTKHEPHIQPQIASQVTAIARSVHYPYLLDSRDPIYCDTDCVAQGDEMPSSTNLGDMKHEDHFEWFQAYLPKLYHGKSLTSGDVKNKAKGFGGWNKETFREGIVGHLAGGGAVNVKGPAKMLTLLAGDSMKPREKKMVKQVRSCYDKRIVNADGTTRPHKIWE